VREIAGFVKAQAPPFGRVSQRTGVSLSTKADGHIQLGRLSPLLKRSRSGTARSEPAIVQSAADSWRPQESSGRREAKCAAGLPDDRDSVIMSSILLLGEEKREFFILENLRDSTFSSTKNAVDGTLCGAVLIEPVWLASCCSKIEV
jgi:hypothetical protein